MSKRKFPNLKGIDKEEARRVASRCAAMRHVLEPTSGSGWVPEFGYGIAFRCVNCGSWRFDTRSNVDDSIIVRSYDLSPEYKEAISDKQSHGAWVSEYVAHMSDDEVNRNPDAPDHRQKGQKNSYPRNWQDR